jgi:hypothetical protein
MDKLSEAEFESMIHLLKRYASTELDQFSIWKLNTRYGEVFVSIANSFPEGEEIATDIELFLESKRAYGKSKSHSRDKLGNVVYLGDQIRVLAIDERILEHLPKDEVEELNSFIGEVFTILHINTDDSVLVEKGWRSGDEIMGHGVAVFPEQFEACKSGT